MASARAIFPVCTKHGLAVSTGDIDRNAFSIEKLNISDQ
jgi:hypothetical protein